MNAGFQNQFVGESSDGKNFVLTSALLYVTEDNRLLRAPVGMLTDGPSIPAGLESIVHPHGPHYLPAIMHDAAYGDFLEVQAADGLWQRLTLTKVESDHLFLEAMRVNGTALEPRLTIYEAVHLGGQHAFDEDRKRAEARI